MEYDLTSFQERMRKFRMDIDVKSLKSIPFIFHLAGWFLVYYFLIYALNLHSGWAWIWMLFLGYFWFTLNRDIFLFFKPPVEVLLGLVLVFYILIFPYLNSLYTRIVLSGSLVIPQTQLPGIIVYFLLGILTLLIGLILSINTPLRSMTVPAEQNLSSSARTGIYEFQQNVIFWYVLLGLVAHQMVFFENIYYLYMYEFILLLLLLNKTIWLEKLSRYELWTYFIFFLIAFLLIHDPDGFQKIKFLEGRNKFTWFSYPLYLHLLVKIYFLALVIKIPLVLIYNHASLARKISMAGFFQSTFPQFFQFIFLICIFFFFISGWQADNVRESIEHEFARIRSGEMVFSDTYYHLTIRPGDQSLLCSGYAPFNLNLPLNEQGILAMTRSRDAMENTDKKEDYFLYTKESDSLRTLLHLVKIDTTLVNRVLGRLNVPAASGLICYPYAPKEWQEFIYKMDFLNAESDLRIYPFSFLSKNSSWSVISRSEKDSDSSARVRIMGYEDYFGEQKFVIGRIFLPVLRSETSQLPYFAFDIYLAFSISFWTSSLVKIAFALIILFFLLNFFVIGRVGKFGEEINRIIIQRFQQLKSGIKEISAGHLDYKFQIEGEDEFVEVARHFNQMGDRLKKTIAEAREKDRLDQEMQIARQVQLSLLPEKLPRIPGYQIAASIQTANEVGGDFYDVLSLPRDRYLFTLGDVSGKGSSAAFYMAQIISLLRYSQQFSLEPLEIALRLNEYFSTQIKDRQIFITAVIGILDALQNRIQFVRAGHTLPILIPGDLRKEITEVKCEGLGIGLTNSRQKFEETLQLVKMDLSEDDRVLFFTDGVVEAARPYSDPGSDNKMEVFGEQRLKNILMEVREQNAREILSALEGELNTFYGTCPRVDDHTLLIIQKL